MLDDFTPIVHALDGRTIKVWAIADVHIGAKEADIAGFQRFLKRVENDPDSFIVIVGDLLNVGIRSANCPTDIYEETMPVHAQIEKAAELLAPVADRILGCVGGNHEARAKKAVDLDPLFQVMVLIRKPDLYRPNMAFVRVNLGKGNTKDHYALLLVHGKSANAKRKFAYSVEGVDAIISGHTHDPIVEKPARLVFTQRNNVVIRPLVSLTACSWLDYGGYGAANLYLPKSTSDPQALVLEYTASNSIPGQIRVTW